MSSQQFVLLPVSNSLTLASGQLMLSPFTGSIPIATRTQNQSLGGTSYILFNYRDIIFCSNLYQNRRCNVHRNSALGTLDVHRASRDFTPCT